MAIWTRKNWDVEALVEVDPSTSPAASKLIDVELDVRGDAPSVDVATRCQCNNAQPEYLYFGRGGKRWTLQNVNAAELDNYLASDEFAALVQRVAAGYSERYDGTRYVGVWSDDADAACDEIGTALDALDGGLQHVDGAGLWEIADWCGNSAEVAGITADTTDDELAKLAADIATDASLSHVVLAGDVSEYLRDRRDGLRSNDN